MSYDTRHDFRLVNLIETLFIECSHLASTTPSSTARDLVTLRSRVENEGLSFLTITLPNFARDFFQALEHGSVSSDLFLGWKKRLRLPAFMQGFVSLVFDGTTGGLLPNASTEAIRAIRQICFFTKKIRLECTQSRVDKALDKYICTDLTLDKTFDRLDRFQVRLFSKVSSLVVGSIFNDFDPLRLRFRHGPGATSDSLRGNKKFSPELNSYSSELEKYFPRGNGIFWNTEESLNHDSKDLKFSDPTDFSVKVTSVPKTLKSPRVIAMEPTFRMLLQQGIKEYMTQRLEEHVLTKGHVNFTDQSINQRLARESSKTGRYATLDLSEASDRVHNELVKLMFDSVPILNECLQLTRSSSAEMPDGRRIDLNKFASMGSALCFPVESLFFFTVILVGRINYLLQQDRIMPSITLALIKRLSREIFVYGDDLIIPQNEVKIITETLTSFGSVIGLDKSYFRSKFRESCGMDAYNGIDITPCYIRYPIPGGNLRRHSADIISLISTANILFDKGYWSTASQLKILIEKLTGSLPVVESKSAGLGWIFDIGSTSAKKRVNVRYQRLEVQTLVPTCVYEKDVLQGYPALHKCLLNLEMRNSDPLKGVFDPTRKIILSIAASDKEHLYRSARPYVLNLKRRFTPPG